MKTRSKIMMYVIETWYRIDIVDTNIFALHWLFDGNILLSIHIACNVENQNDIKSERLINYVASTNSSISISFSLFSLFVRIACHSIELHSICNIRIEKSDLYCMDSLFTNLSMNNFPWQNPCAFFHLYFLVSELVNLIRTAV